MERIFIRLLNVKKFLYICRMFKSKKSKYYWDVTRNMSYEESQEHKRKKLVNKIINKFKIKR